MKLTYWAWLVALGSAGVVNAKIAEIQCWNANMGGEWWFVDTNHPAANYAACVAVATALNGLEGVSNIVCDDSTGVNEFRTKTDECNATVTALNKLINCPNKQTNQCVYCGHIEADVTMNYLDGNCDESPNGVGLISNLTAILQGPTCKHGNPIPGPSGGGNCTGACDHGWQGSNCDSPSPGRDAAAAPHPPYPFCDGAESDKCKVCPSDGTRNCTARHCTGKKVCVMNEDISQVQCLDCTKEKNHRACVDSECIKPDPNPCGPRKNCQGCASGMVCVGYACLDCNAQQNYEACARAGCG